MTPFETIAYALGLAVFIAAGLAGAWSVYDAWRHRR